jgi:hypothetical protein
MALISRKSNLTKGKGPTPTLKTATKPRMVRSGGKLYAHVAVLQNGEPLVEATRKLRSHGTIAITSGSRGLLAIPHYPLPDGALDLVEMDKGRARLIVDAKWEGFCTSGGELVRLERSDRGRREVELGRGDYASIGRDDLRVMVRVDDRPRRRSFDQQDPVRALARDWRRSMIGHFFPSLEERRSLAIATLAALVVVGSFAAGLAMRPRGKPMSIEDIKDEYMVAFVAPEHLESAPETLQTNLDRSHFIHSVLVFYQAFTGLLIGAPRYDADLLLPTSVRLYEEVNAAAADALAVKRRKQQEIDGEQARLKDVAVLSVPSVLGESVSGRMLRTLDKIGIMQHAMALNLEAKRAIVPEFQADDPYDYDNYRDAPNGKKGNGKVPDAIKAIRVWEQSTDEEAMYLEAKDFATKARVIQNRQLPHGSTLTPLSAAPLGLPDGSKYASFLGDIDFFLADEKLLQLQASEWGAPRKPAKAKEALVGEIDPALIERYIKQNRYQLQLCYELALRRNEAASGTMEWRWRIDSRGVISDVALVASAIKDQSMIQCIQRKISAWSFPRPRRGSVEVSYPFEFSPSKG